MIDLSLVSVKENYTNVLLFLNTEEKVGIYLRYLALHCLDVARASYKADVDGYFPSIFYNKKNKTYNVDYNIVIEALEIYIKNEYNNVYANEISKVFRHEFNHVLYPPAARKTFLIMVVFSYLHNISTVSLVRQEKTTYLAKSICINCILKNNANDKLMEYRFVNFREEIFEKFIDSEDIKNDIKKVTEYGEYELVTYGLKQTSEYWKNKEIAPILYCK